MTYQCRNDTAYVSQLTRAKSGPINEMALFAPFRRSEA
jgi:hypothetical protein